VILYGQLRPGFQRLRVGRGSRFRSALPKFGYADRFDSVKAFAEALVSEESQPKAAAQAIAVLPFANLSPDPNDEYLSDGISEEIINSLVNVPGLQVIARTSAFAFKGRNQDVRKIAARLGVSRVLEGSVRRSGQKLRITAQLVRAEDGHRLWSERFDRGTDDIFAIQDEIGTRFRYSESSDRSSGTANRNSETADPNRATPQLNLDLADLNCGRAERNSETATLDFETPKLNFEMASQNFETANPNFETANRNFETPSRNLKTVDRDFATTAPTATERSVQIFV